MDRIIFAGMLLRIKIEKLLTLGYTTFRKACDSKSNPVRKKNENKIKEKKSSKTYRIKTNNQEL